MKLTDKQKQKLLKLVEEKHMYRKDFLYIEDVSDEEAEWNIHQAIRSKMNGCTIYESAKEFNNFQEIISACKEHTDKAWEYAYTKDKELEKWLGSFEKDEEDGTLFEYKPKGDE